MTSTSLTDLIELTTTVLSLTDQFTRNLTTTSSSDAPTPSSSIPDGPPDPLAVLHTTATLLKAHVTKLGLLLLNRPFTPSALQTEIRAISTTCLPAMMGAVEICRPETYGTMLSGEVKARVGRCVREVEGLVRRVRRKAMEVRDAASGGRKEGDMEKVTQGLGGLRGGVIDAREGRREGQDGESRDTLARTGTGWEACDGLMELVGLGLRGVVVKKAEEWRDMLKDAIEELREWGEGEDEGSEDDEDGTDEDEDSIQDMFGAEKLPKGHEGLRVQLEMALKKVKLVVTLYQAVIKRRLKTLPAPPDISIEISRRVDEIILRLKGLPDRVDEMANSFYELDEERAQEFLDDVCQEAQAAAGSISRNWQGQEDEFSVWSSKWVDVLDKSGNVATS